MKNSGVAMRGEQLAEGKTKIIYADAGDPEQAIIVSKDDITAGDGVRRNTLPGKGALSGRTTANVFKLLAAACIPTHFVDAPANDEMVVPVAENSASVLIALSVGEGARRVTSAERSTASSGSTDTEPASTNR